MFEYCIQKGGYLESDPAIRTEIHDYHPNDQDEVRRAYLVNGPSRPNMTEYPLILIGTRHRSFNNRWYKDDGWLEYSISEKAVFWLEYSMSEEAFTSGGGNCKMTSPVIRKELANACAVETVKKMVGEIGDDFKFLTLNHLRLARFYPNYFKDVSDKELSCQLESYIDCVKMDDNFSNLKGILDLCRTLVRTKKCKTFGLVYTLLKLALSLPVATSCFERVFSGMKYVKNELRN